MQCLRNLCIYGRFHQHHRDWPYVVGDVCAVVLIVGYLLLLSGCVSMGRKVDETQLTQFERGRTTYYDVVAVLGKPSTSTLNHDGTRQIVYTYTQMQHKPENFIPIVGGFVGGTTSETTNVILDFDSRQVLMGFSATTGDMKTGTGLVSGARQKP